MEVAKQAPAVGHGKMYIPQARGAKDAKRQQNLVTEYKGPDQETLNVLSARKEVWMENPALFWDWPPAVIFIDLKSRPDPLARLVKCYDEACKIRKRGPKNSTRSDGC